MEYAEFFERFFPDLTPHQSGQLIHYVSLIKTYNQRFNLISRSDVENVWEHHIYPCVVAANLVEIPIAAAVLDVGSGSGLPGIPLKIVRPDLKMILVDSIRKKILFLKKVVDELGLESAETLNMRLGVDEDRSGLQGRFNVVTARAVATAEILVPLATPLLKNDGYLLLWKGESDLPEIDESSKKYNYSYDIIRIPGEYSDFSRRLGSTLFVKIYPDFVFWDGPGEP